MAQPKTFIGKTAVLQGLAEHPAVKTVLAWKPEALLDAKFDRDELTLDHCRRTYSRRSLPPCRLPATTSLKM